MKKTNDEKLQQMQQESKKRYKYATPPVGRPNKSPLIEPIQLTDFELKVLLIKQRAARFYAQNK